MHKRAPTDFPVHDFIAERWSPRAFSDKPVAPDVLAKSRLRQRAGPLPAATNNRGHISSPLRTMPENFAKLVSVLVPGNVTWAQHAPVLALAVAQLSFAKSGTPNRNAQYDVGAASAWLTVEATSRGIIRSSNGRLRPRQSAASFRNTRRLGAYRRNRHRLSGRSRFFAATFARSRSSRHALANRSPRL